MRTVGALLSLAILLAGCTAPETGDDAEEGADGRGDGEESGGGNEQGGPGEPSDTPPEGAESVEASTWSDGDAWTYRIGVYLPGTEEPVLDRFTLTNRGAEEHEGFQAYRLDTTRSDEDSYYTQDDLSPIYGDREVPYYDFPLWVGKTWRVVGADPTQPSDAEVEAEETRSTTAGTFPAWRIKLTYESGGYELYWFADAVKNEIRREVHGGQYLTVTDLESYDVEEPA